MRLNLIFYVCLISLMGFVNCIGPFKKEEKDSSEDLKKLFLINELSAEFLEINGKWKDNVDNGSFDIFGVKKIVTGFDGYFISYYSYYGSSTFYRSIVKFDNNSKILFVMHRGEPVFGSFAVDCNGNGIRGEPIVPCYSRIRWTKYNGKFYYCEDVYNKGSFEEAEQDPTRPDATNPSSSGCGDSYWTRFDEN